MSVTAAGIVNPVERGPIGSQAFLPEGGEEKPARASVFIVLSKEK